MKKILVSLAVLWCVALGVQAQDNQEYEKQVAKMLEMTHTMDAMKQIFPQMTAMLKQQLPQAPDEFWKELDASMNGIYRPTDRDADDAGTDAESTGKRVFETTIKRDSDKSNFRLVGISVPCRDIHGYRADWRDFRFRILSYLLKLISVFKECTDRSVVGLFTAEWAFLSLIARFLF